MNDRRRGNESKKPLELPEGVNPAEWALEKNAWQNPRIRCFLGCIRHLDDVLESNFALLHCSPSRLKTIWAIVLEVSDLIRTDLAPLLEAGSKVPELDEAIREARRGVEELEQSVLARLDGLPRKPKNDEVDRLRPLLCEVVGRMHSSVMEALGRIMEADPRSRQDSDFFLSRQFARDVDDAEWLHTSVVRLEKYVMRIDRFRPSSLSSVAQFIIAEGTLPSEGVWATTQLFLDELTDHLVPQLQKMVGLRGIRLEELQIIKGFVSGIPQHCAVISGIFQFGGSAVDAIEGATADHADCADNKCRAVEAIKELATTQLVTQINAIDEDVAKLAAFIPEWRGKLTERRALAFLKKQK